jgi:hypothetical protein
METREINSWQEYLDTVNQIKNDYADRQIGEVIIGNPILFRGQADAEWPLKTTLERYTDNSWDIKSYTKLTYRCRPQIESFTERTWNLPDLAEVEKQIESSYDDFFIQLPCYDYWVYLRHHGFPSPLLDWSQSPFIAAFFAFELQNKAPKAAIYAYVETPGGVKMGWGGSPQINVQGPYVSTHKRHFLQQCWYTFATKAIEEDKKHQFVCHEEILKRGNKRQDILIKIVLPRDKRTEILNNLYEYNINRFSLFHSEEALIQALAFKEIELRKQFGVRKANKQ